MSENLDENGVPVPEGQKPEPSGFGRQKLIYFALGLAVALVVVVVGYVILEPAKEEPAAPAESANELPLTPTPATSTSDEMVIPTKIAGEPTTTPEAATGAADETADADAEVEPADSASLLGRIAFIDTDGRLGTVLPDGNELRLLTEPGRFYQFPAWSPANDLLAAIGGDFAEAGVYVTTGEGSGDLREVYSDREESPIYLYWSPNGRDVSFIATHPDGLALHLAPADGSSTSQVLATAPGSFFWDWLPDAERVLIHTGFRAQAGDDTRTAFVPAGGDGPASEVEEDGFFQAPAVSADGRYYALGDTGPGGSQWLKVWNIDEERPRRAIPHQGAIAMGWSPTNALLAYTSPDRPAPTFYGPLHLVDVETGATDLLVPQRVVAFFWSPDGRSIAYITLSQRVEPDDEGPGLEETSPQAKLPPGERPRAAFRRVRLARVLDLQEQRLLLDLHVADVESGQSRLLYTFEPTDIFVNQFLPFSDQYALSHRLWSPDGKAIVMASSDDDGEDRIVVVPLDRSEPISVAEGQIAFWSHQ